MSEYTDSLVHLVALGTRESRGIYELSNGVALPEDRLPLLVLSTKLLRANLEIGKAFKMGPPVGRLEGLQRSSEAALLGVGHSSGVGVRIDPIDSLRALCQLGLVEVDRISDNPNRTPGDARLVVHYLRAIHEVEKAFPEVEPRSPGEVVAKERELLNMERTIEELGTLLN
jgi:hypothetical protein